MRFGWVSITITGLLALSGCDKKPATDTAASSKATAAPATATASAGPVAPAKAKTGKKPTAKGQAQSLKGKKPTAGGKGSWVDIPETDGTFMIPEGWTSETEGEVVVAASKNETTGVVFTTYDVGVDPTGLLGELAKALSFVDCEWKNAEDVTLGKDDLPAKVADGVCLQNTDEGAIGVYVLYAMVPGEELNVFVMGGVDENAEEADAEAMVNIFATVKKK